MAGEFLSSFLGGVSGSTVGSAVVRLFLDSAQYDAGLAKARGSLGATAAAADAPLSKLKSGLATVVPALAIIGVASVKTALDFENAFTKIAALSNASADQVEAWKDQVLSLSGETAVAPQELADALFFLASAGLKADQIMPALEASAKGAAAGMGTTADLANIAASALNAYAGSGLTAAGVMDTLTAAIKAGRAEPEEFAQSLGRILPIAQKAGVGFDEVTASVASLTNIGLDVDEAVTSVRGALIALEAPGSQAAKTLASVGISTDQLRQSISEDGLLGALNLLDEATNGNIDTMRKIIPNVRALITQFGLTGVNAERAAAAFDEVTNSAGFLDKAFGVAQSGPGFEFKSLLNDLRIAAINLGEILLPLVRDIIGVFSALLGPIKGLLGLLKPLGPAIGIAVTAFLTFKTIAFIPVLIEKMAAAFITLEAAMGANLTTQIATSAAFGRVAIAAASARLALTEFTAAYLFLGADTVPTDNLKDLEAQLVNIRSAFAAGNIGNLGGLAEQVKFLSTGFHVNAEAVELAITKNISYAEALKLIPSAAEAAEIEVAGLTRTVEGIGRVGDQARSVLDLMGTSLDEFAAAAVAAKNKGADAFKTFADDTLGKAADALAKWKAAASASISGVGDVLSELADKAHLSVDQIRRSFQQAARDARKFGQDLLTIANTGGKSAEDLAAALLEMGPSAAGLANTIAGASKKARDRMVSDFGAIIGAGDSAANKLAGPLVGTLKSIESVLKDIARGWGFTLTDDKDSVGKAGQDIEAVRQSLIDTSRPWTVGLDLRDNATAGINNVRNNLNSLNDKTVTLTVNEVHRIITKRG